MRIGIGASGCSALELRGRHRVDDDGARRRRRSGQLRGRMPAAEEGLLPLASGVLLAEAKSEDEKPCWGSPRRRQAAGRDYYYGRE